MNVRRPSALVSLLAFWSCGETTAPAPPPPPPPPALLATGDWTGDWRIIPGEAEFFRIRTVLSDASGTLSGTCKFEVQSLLPVFLACDRAFGTRTGDHTGGSVSASFDFTTAASGVFTFNGTLVSNVMSGHLQAGASGSGFPGYSFNRPAAAGSATPRAAGRGSSEFRQLTTALQAALERK